MRMRKKLKNAAISKPIRMWIDGKCFNIKKWSDTKNSQSDTTEPEGTQISNETDFIVRDDGKVSVSFELPPYYYGKLTHFPNRNLFFDNLTAISSKLNTSIKVPDTSGTIEKIYVCGDSEAKVKESFDGILSIIAQIRQMAKLTHFIGIPLVSDEIQSNFEIFKSEVLKFENTRGLEESIFQSALKLHLTIDVLVLLSEAEKKEAKKALQEFNDDVLKPLIARNGPIKIHVSGITKFDDEKIDKVNVVFAKAKFVNETDEVNLQKIANALLEHFYEKGFLKTYKDNVVLHMTLINTKYRKKSSYRNSRRRYESLDATKIMEKFKDFEFGTCEFKTLTISEMSSVGEDGFYRSLIRVDV
ncbi:unnamed protein product [Phyllotreta striolata]|uniref:A-kinase anchor protein 7-like phosphoesterase domain-containing protein n=1 Tax=Phyllotreta striolata TaxID=444603 RepID=A0A9N9XQ94_PHYSR|nr:unnamed protein product [Phyllotreta striolata]